MKRKRLIRGRDWDGWAWRFPNGQYHPSVFVRPAECVYYPHWDPRTRKSGGWVRVRFVEVKRRRRP